MFLLFHLALRTANSAKAFLIRQNCLGSSFTLVVKARSMFISYLICLSFVS